MGNANVTRSSLSPKRTKSSQRPASLIREEVRMMIAESSRGKGNKDNEIDLSNRKVNDEMMVELCESIERLHGNANVLILDHNELTSTGSSILFTSLVKSSLYLKQISLSGNGLDDSCLLLIGEYVQKNRVIESLGLGNNKVSDRGVKMLASSLNGHPSIRCIDLRNNKGISNKSLPTLIKVIESSRISTLHIYGTSVSNVDILAIYLAISDVKCGEDKIDLGGKGVIDDDIQRLCDKMMEFGCQNVDSINLWNNRLTSSGASILFTSLKDSISNIKTINLIMNLLDDDCMEILGEAIKGCPFIENIWLSDNKITDKGIEKLFNYLIGNSIMNVLGLTGNKGITNASASRFLELAKGTHLTEIFLSSTMISNDNQLMIQEELQVPIYDRDIPTKSNSKSAAKLS